jgi:hypothetical protein
VPAVKPAQRFVRDYEWFHTAVGVLGNLMFFVGSVLFLWQSTQRTGVWLFIVGAGAMLLGSVGRGLVDYERHDMGPTTPQDK